MGKALKYIEPLSLAAVFAVLILCALGKSENGALLTLLVAVFACIPFFLRFELQKPRPRDFMPVAVLTALAVVGRLVFAPIPNFQPVSALVILTGIYFGRQSGFLTGAFAALISNMMLGQGAWTPWQMYSWGLMGYGAGVLFEKRAARESDGSLGKSVWFIYLYGVISCFLYGVLMDSWFIVGFVSQFTPEAIFTAYAAGAVMNIAHEVGTVIFLGLVLVPWGKKFARIKQKYDIGKPMGAIERKSA